MVLLFSQELENEAVFLKGHLRKETGQGEVLRRLKHVRRSRVCVFCFEEVSLIFYVLGAEGCSQVGATLVLYTEGLL